MGGLTALCALLGAAALWLLILHLRDTRRIRYLAGQTAAFLSAEEAPLDVALREDAVAQLHNEIADLQQALLRAQHLQREECSRTSALTADISHQLKTPLTTLRLYTELDGSPHMDASLEQIERMETLIAALLRLERLCADGYPFRFTSADAADIVREQWENLPALRGSRTLKIVGEAAVRCDVQWMGEAFLNLLKNACEHTKADGVITVTLERTEAAFFCTVADDGGGASLEDLPHLFDRFYRGRYQTGGGSGIGLAIVREIVRRHHGHITAENDGKGLKMTIRMPMLDRNLTKT